MNICLDIDGVLCEYNFPEIVKNFFGVDLSSKAIFAYDLADVLGVAPVLINTMFKEQVYGKPTFNKGALETLRKWQTEKHYIGIWSNRTKYMGKMGLYEWMIKYKIPFNDLDFRGENCYDVHIDDCPSKLMSTDSKVKLLYSQPWNIGCLNITKSLIRVRNWQEIQDIIKKGGISKRNIEQ